MEDSHSSLVDHLVVGDDLAVRRRHIVGLIRETVETYVSTCMRTGSIDLLVGILTCLSLAILAAHAREILEFEVVNLVDDDAEDSESVARVWRGPAGVRLLGSVDRGTSLDLRTT